MNNQRHFLRSVMAVYFLCFLFRIIEYFVVRTDSTIFGEAFIHKIIGIIILFAVTYIFSYTKKDIGFARSGKVKKLLWGLCLGAVFYSLSYVLEIMLLQRAGNFKRLEMYVTSYSVNGNIGNHKELIFFLICIIGNVINVVMEEGVFRGLFQKILEQKYKFITSAIIASVLFGVWHVVGPIRSYSDGLSSTNQLIINILILVFSSTLVGFKYALLTKLTGSIYMAIGDHFVNNTIINMLHVISTTGADELQVLRISIAQSVSFLAVLVFYLVCKKRLVKENK